MKITAFNVQNFRGVEHVALDVDGVAYLVIQGANGAGKSSVLDAIEHAFWPNAAKVTAPVRNGADEAQVSVALSEGGTKWELTRRTPRDGRPALKVTQIDPSGARIKLGADWIDTLAQQRALDPSAFLRMSPKDQASSVARVAGLADKLMAWQTRYEDAYADRRQAKKRADEAHKAASGQGEPPVPPAPTEARVDVAAVAAELEALRAAVSSARSDAAAAAAEWSAAKGRVEWCERAVSDARRAITEAEARLAELRRTEQAHVASLTEAREHAELASETAELASERAAAAAANPRGPELRAQIDSASARNAEIDRQLGAHREAEAVHRRWEDLVRAAQDAAIEAEEAEAAIAALQAERRALLQSAAMPLDGLEIDEAGNLLFGGVPIEGLSSAEQLRVALWIVHAQAPRLRLVMLRHGAMLDDTSLAAVEAFAREHDYTVIVERVGTTTEGAITIEAGHVAGEGV